MLISLFLLDVYESDARGFGFFLLFLVWFSYSWCS